MDISARGFVLTKPALSYLEVFLKALGDQYEAATNPDGYVILAVAENKLTYSDVILPKLLELHRSVTEEDLTNQFPPFYGNMAGNARFREELAKYLTAEIVTNTTFVADAENIVTCSGCGSAVDMIAWVFGSADEACIIPAPYYPAFRNDLNARARVSVEPAYLEYDDANGEWSLTENCLDAAVESAVGKGKRPSMLLLTNPNNPIGQCYTDEELKLALRWARKNGLVVISDEIYAKSCHSPETVGHRGKFKSLIDVALEEDFSEGKVGDDVVVLYGFSKDFCLSGMRVGMMYSENEEFLKATGSLSYFASISTDTQCLLTKMLQDTKWVKHLHSQNNHMLKLYCDRLLKILQKYGIPYTNPTSGLFVVLDMRKYLAPKDDDSLTWEAEQAFFNHLVEECRVIMVSLTWHLVSRTCLTAM